MLWRHPDVLKLWALYILFVTRDLGLAPAAIGAVFSVANVAGLAGAIVAGGLGARLGSGLSSSAPPWSGGWA